MCIKNNNHNNSNDDNDNVNVNNNDNESNFVGCIDQNCNIASQGAIYHIQHRHPQMKFAVWNRQGTAKGKNLI